MADNTSTNLSKIERDELIAICEKLRGDSSDPNTEADINRLITFIRSRKYGLMFERHEEEVDRLLKDHLPTFYDAEDKTIKTKDTEDCNFLLEGDNLHSLKLLEKTHKGKIDVIYIDPPYNTGNNDFIYADNMVGQDDGFRHSKWLSFMKERLEIARNLLSNEGVIFISIDDNEQAQLKLLCDGIFGEENRLSIIACVNNRAGRSDDKYFATSHEYLLVYAKNAPYVTIGGFPLSEETMSGFKYEDTIGKYRLDGLKKTGKNCYKEDRPNMYYPIYYSPKLNTVSLDREFDDAIEIYPKINGRDGRWRWGKDTFIRNKDINVQVKRQKDGYVVYVKTRLETNGEIRTAKAKTVWDLPDYSTTNGTKAFKELFGTKSFESPKSVEYIKDIIMISTRQSATILDFFAGSGTTGQAVLELNQEDGGNRHFILCTNNENNICEEITYQRLKTVITGIRPDGTKYSEGIKANLKYFKTDMVAFNDEEMEEKLIDSSECLIQLENSALLTSPDIDVAYCDEDLPEIFENKPSLKTLYVLEDVLFNAEQTSYIESHNVEIKRVADCYYEGV